MVKTGKYKYNPETKEVEKVSDEIPSLKTSIYFPKTGGHYSESLGRHFESKEQKRSFLKEKGFAEAG